MTNPFQLLRPLVVPALFLAACLVATETASAAFDPNRLLTDEGLTDHATMNEAQIQSFLSAKGSCLAGVNPADLGKRNGATIVSNSRSAAGIIYDAANGKRYDGSNSGLKINPQVLIVTLQKEYSLITQSCATLQSWYGQNYLTKAVGYNVPNTLNIADPDCLNTFYHQLLGNWCEGNAPADTGAYLGAAQAFRRNFDLNKVGPGGAYPWPQSFTIQTRSSQAGNTTIQPYSKATSLLYRYTPYVYNGNYNFFNYFNDWFGTAPAEITESEVNTHGGITGVDTRARLTIKSTGLSDAAFSVAIIARRKDGNGNYTQNYDFGTSSVTTMSFGDTRTIEFTRALPVGDYKLYAATYFRGEWRDVTNIVRTFSVRPAAISASVDAKDYYKNGSPVSVSATFRNNESFRVYLSGVGIASRLDGRNLDFPFQGATYLDPGQERTYTFTRTFGEGTVTLFPIYRIDTPDWFPTSPRIDRQFGSWADGIYRLRVSAVATDQDPRYYDQPTDFRFTITNPSAESIVISRLRLAGRRFGTENFDFGMAENVTVPAGATIPIHFRTTLGKSGEFQFWPIYLSGNGVDWVSFKPATGASPVTQLRVY